MEPTPAPPPPPPLSAPSATAYPDSVDSSPRSRNTDSWGEDNSLYPSNNGATAAAAPPGGLTKLRLMCSYGGHIVPRPHDKSLCYVGGDTRIVVVDRHTTLSDLTHRLSKTLLRSSSSLSTSSQTSSSFTLKYQLPSEDLDSLISVTTDEDLENMIDEYERLNSSAAVNKSSRLRLFLFPTKPESVSSIGSLLENSTKSEDWFLNALNGTTSGFSDTSSVNCLLGLDDDVAIPEKKDANSKSVIGKTLRGNNSGQDVHSVPDSPMLETTSSFGSASSSPSLANLPPIRVHVDDHQKVGGGIEEQFSQMSVQSQQHKQQDDGGFVAAPAQVVVTGVPLSSTAAISEYPNRVFSDDERSEQGMQMAYRKQQQQQQQQYQQQKQSMGFDLASPDSVSSDSSITNPLSRQKPQMIYQDPIVQIQSSSNTNNRPVDPNNIPDQNTRIQMQQQQQVQDPAYLMPMTTTQVDPQHPQLHQQQPQFIHTAVPPPQYMHHHHPSGAVPMASYYQIYPTQSQHHPHHQALDQQNFVYYVPARQAPQGYMPMQQQQQQQPNYADASTAAASAAPPSHSQSQPPSSGVYTTSRNAQAAPKADLPAGVYRTANSGAPQLVQVPSSQQHQLQPQYVGYSQVHHQSQSVASSASVAGGNYGYEIADPAQGQNIYYAAQPLPPQSAAQYQTMTSNLPVEAGSHLPSDNSMKQQQVRTSQP